MFQVVLFIKRLFRLISFNLKFKTKYIELKKTTLYKVCSLHGGYKFDKSKFTVFSRNMLIFKTKMMTYISSNVLSY